MLLGDVGYAFADEVRCAALPRAVDRIAGLAPVTSPYHAGRGVGCDSLLSHEPRKVLAARAQHREIVVKGLFDHLGRRLHKRPVSEVTPMRREEFTR
jgi:hypothetical protein